MFNLAENKVAGRYMPSCESESEVACLTEPLLDGFGWGYGSLMWRKVPKEGVQAGRDPTTVETSPFDVGPAVPGTISLPPCQISTSKVCALF